MDYSQRFKIVTAVHTILVKDGKILLARRINTGWQDGMYHIPGGHVDGGETMANAVIREAKEELGIAIDPTGMKLGHVMHRAPAGEDGEYLDLFFIVKKWEGEPKINEPERCDDLNWFEPNSLPENIIPHIRKSIEAVFSGETYSEYGW
ncbi:MAG: NUDIX domain-containing protein [Candidatus Liptonbacteria bacterium]